MEIPLSSIVPDSDYSDHLSGSEILSASTYGPNDKAVIDTALFDLFELVRHYSGGNPARLNSAFRNFIPAGGSKNSSHLRGKAFDIGLSSGQMNTLKKNIRPFMSAATAAGLCGFGVYDWGVHIDVDNSLPIKNRYTVPNCKDCEVYKIRHWGRSPWFISLTGSQPVSLSSDEKYNPGEDGQHISDKEKRTGFVFLLLVLFTIKALF